MGKIVGLEDLLDAAETTAVQAGRLVHELCNRPRTISPKGFRDIVTDADIAAQALIATAVRARFPTHGFLTEEPDAQLPADGDVIWVIDPLDGTTNYSRQQPLYCVSVAAVDGRQLNTPQPTTLAGAIYDPARDELFSATQGGGAWLNGRRMQVSQVAQLSEAILGLDWSKNQRLRQSALNLLDRFAHDVYGIRAIGSAALAMAWVATGRLDLYLNYNLKPWDVAAAALLLAEAGGRCSGADGAPWVWRNSGIDFVASNGRVHQAFINRLQA
jgi:myo-inositol-1(or 4)-monophosphatase